MLQAYDVRTGARAAGYAHGVLSPDWSRVAYMRPAPDGTPELWVTGAGGTRRVGEGSGPGTRGILQFS